MVLEPGSQRDSASFRGKKAQAIRLVTELGPRIPEIASRIGVHKETVRYWYHSLLKRGFTVHASYDFERLGMKRIVMLVDFHEALASHAADIFVAMNNLCYVVSFAKIIPEGLYRVSVSVPADLVPEYLKFLQGLRETGFFSSLETFTFESFRNIPMRTGFYDFETGAWDFDWSSPHPDASDVLAPLRPPEPRERLDGLDLHLLHHLRIDANRDVAEIRDLLKTEKQIDVNYKTLDYHYRDHVIRKGLIKSYAVNWMGTGYSFKEEKATHRKHRYLGVDLIVRDISEQERMHLMGATNGLPFQWSEAIGRDYFTQLAFPTESIPEAFLYLEKVLKPVRGRARHLIADQSNAISFSVDPSLYDQATKDWRFDRAGLTEKFANLLLRIKSGEG